MLMLEAKNFGFLRRLKYNRILQGFYLPSRKMSSRGCDLEVGFRFRFLFVAFEQTVIENVRVILPERDQQFQPESLLNLSSYKNKNGEKGEMAKK